MGAFFYSVFANCVHAKNNFGQKFHVSEIENLFLHQIVATLLYNTTEIVKNLKLFEVWPSSAK